MALIAVVNYGAGNLMSVSNALSFIGADSIIADSPEELERADAVILPGVGAFPAAMRRLNESGFTAKLIKCAAEKPLLGICLGMQMLFDESYEIEKTAGLSLLPGSIVKIQHAKKLPHIGWNDLRLQRKSPLTENVPDGSYVYFVHSFRVSAKDEKDIVADTFYGEDIPAIVHGGNVFGCQFHPEKSGEPGLQMLKNFCKLC